MPNWPNFELSGDVPTEWPRNGIRKSYDTTQQRRVNPDVRTAEQVRKVTRIVFSVNTNTVSTAGAQYVRFIEQQFLSNIILSHGELNDVPRDIRYVGNWDIERVSTSDNSNSTSITTATISQYGEWTDALT